MIGVKTITQEAFDVEKTLVFKHLLQIAEEWKENNTYHPMSIASTMLIASIVLLKNEQEKIVGFNSAGETFTITDEKIRMIVAKTLDDYNDHQEDFYKQQEQEEE